MEDLRKSVSEMLSVSSDALSRSQAMAQRTREEVRLLLAQYYADVLQPIEGQLQEEEENLVEYYHDDRRSVLKVRAFNKTHVYGYQYLAQGLCFSPDLNFARNAHRLLNSVNLKYVSYHPHSLGPSLSRQVAGLFGRRLHAYTPGCEKDFRGLVIGTLVRVGGG